MDPMNIELLTIMFIVILILVALSATVSDGKD
jgi:hypothetical protein